MPAIKNKKSSKTKAKLPEKKVKTFNIGKIKEKYLNKKYILIFLILLVLIALFLVFKKQIIVASVNGEPITRIKLIRELESQSGKRALETIISKTLVLQEAKKKNISVREEEIDKEIQKIEENLKSQGQKLEDILKLQGTTIETVKEQIKLNLLMKKILQKDINVSEKEVSEYIDKNKGSKPETISDQEYKKQVRTQLEQQKFQEKAQEYLKKLRDKASVNYYLNF